MSILCSDVSLFGRLMPPPPISRLRPRTIWVDHRVSTVIEQMGVALGALGVKYYNKGVERLEIDAALVPGFQPSQVEPPF